MKRAIADLRHDTWHRDQTVDTSETDGNTPQPRPSDNPLAHRDIARGETQHGTGAIRLPKVNFSTGMTFQTGEIDVEAEGVEVGSDHGCGRGLAVHSDGEGFEPTEEDVAVEGGKTCAGRVDEECDALS